MLGVIVFAAAGIWILVFLLVLALCKDAKAGDAVMELGRGRLSGVDGERVVIDLLSRRRDADPRQLRHLA